MYLFGELVNCDVGWRADEDLALVHLREMIDDRCGRDGLASAGRTLNEAERLLKDLLDGVELRVIEVGQIGRRDSVRDVMLLFTIDDVDRRTAWASECE